MDVARRIKDLPPYLFANLEMEIAKKQKEGIDIIDFGVGDPDMPTPKHIVDACCKAAKKPENHRYPGYRGTLAFRQAVALRYKRDYGLSLDPEEEVIALIGSKEGIHNINFALINPGDVVLCPDPGYPVYKTGTMFAGGEAHFMPLLKENNFLPDLDSVPMGKKKKAKMMWINYPNNPTAAVAGKEFYEEVVDFAIDNDIVVCSDEAYSTLTFDDYKASCFLEVEGAREVGIVFDSLSKAYNMTGWRIAYAVGNKEIIEALGKVKSNVDSGTSQIIQEAGVAALTSSQECVEELTKIYQKRRDVFVEGLNRLELSCEKPKATFYVWLEVPEGDSMKFANYLLEEAAVAATPGIGFGIYGEGFLRFAMTQPLDRIKEALERMEAIL